MKMNRNATPALFALTIFCSLFLSRPAMAEWKINNQRSELYFVTTKAGSAGTAAIQEVQTFKKVNGTVDDSGNVTVNIEPGSVDTGIEIRDQRLRDILFNTISYPIATYTGKVSLTEINSLSLGSSREMDLKGKITLCGQTQPVMAKVRVTKLTGNQLRVETRAPVIINAADFGLNNGVEALRKIMGLTVLSSAAPVSFSLVLN